MDFDISTIIVGAIILIVIISLISGILKRYRTCPSDKVMVVFGKVGGNKSAKCIHGGATFVWPIFQNYAYLDLTPFTLTLDLRNALSKQNIRINVPSSFTCAISTDPQVMQNAAERLLGKDQRFIMNLTQDTIIGQMRLIIATMDIEELNTKRDMFLNAVQKNVETELSKIGLRLINANITDIRDESGYIDALGKEAEAKALNEAKKNVAERNRQGNVGEKDQKTQEALELAAKDKEWREGVANQEAAAIAAEKMAELAKRKAVAEANAASIAYEKESERKAREAIANENAAAIVAEKEAEKEQREKIAAANAAAVAAEKQAEANQRAAIATANANASAAEKDAERSLRERVAKANAEAIAAEKDAEREQRQKVAQANADAVTTENEAAANIAMSEAKRRETEAEASARAVSAEKVQKANALAASYAAEQKAELARAERQKATMQADVLIQAEVEKRKIEIAAEAEAEAVRRKAKGAADAILMKMQAEADGYKAQYDARGQGFDALVKAAGGDSSAAYQYLLAEKIDVLVKAQAEAFKNVKIDKITVWDSQNGSTTANFIESLVKSVLPMKDIFNMCGVDLLNFRKDEKDAPADDNKTIDVAPAKPVASKPVVQAKPATPSAKLNLDNL